MRLVLLALLLPLAAPTALAAWSFSLPETLEARPGGTVPLWAEVRNDGPEPLAVRVVLRNTAHENLDAPCCAGLHARSEGNGSLLLAPGATERLRFDLRAARESPQDTVWTILLVAESEGQGVQEARTTLLVRGPPVTPAATLDGAAPWIAGGAGLALLASRPAVRGALLAPFVPLATRLTRGEAEAHATRERMLARVRAEPGIPYADLLKATQAGTGSFVHHLRVLEREGLVVSRRVGARRLLYPVGHPAAARPLSPAQARILRALDPEVGATQAEVAAALGLRQQTVSWHLQRLRSRGLVEPVPGMKAWRPRFRADAAQGP